MHDRRDRRRDPFSFETETALAFGEDALGAAQMLDAGDFVVLQTTATLRWRGERLQLITGGFDRKVLL